MVGVGKGVGELIMVGAAVASIIGAMASESEAIVALSKNGSSARV